ncbi:MAG: AAA family ATPase [Candidatus Chromulinivorax sp.]
MGIITGTLLVGFISKVMSKFKKKKNFIFHDLERFRLAQKIAVIGCAGSGKTYLSKQLANKLDLPIVHLDQYHWQPGWQRVAEEDFSRKHTQLCQEQAWIMDGIYFRHFHERIQATQAIIFLDMPRRVCLWNVIKRAVLYHGKVQDSDPIGCKQQVFSFKFLEFLGWIWNFHRTTRPLIISELENSKKSKLVFVFTSQEEMNAFLEQL